jgi:uncharacterized protein (TIGR00725 family)
MSDPAKPPKRAGEGGRRFRQIAVIGAGECDQASEAAVLAEEVGRRLAEAGVTVVCGGRGGVMEAASRGAARAGGEVIGIVPGVSAEDANPHCTHVVASAIGYARNLAVVASGDAVIAVGGEWGTLSVGPWSRCAVGPLPAGRGWRARRG